MSLARAILKRGKMGARVVSRWDERFFASTRGKIIILLRRSSRTVKQLAEALDLTENAVRAQLTVLQRDGLIQEQPVRAGVGKPAYMYSLTSQAEHLFPKGYGLVLRQLVDILAERSDAAEMDELVRTLGRRLASNYPVPAGGEVRLRLNEAVGVLNDLGGLVQLEEVDDRFHICGYVCPVSEATSAHPEFCGVIETMLTELVGVRVYQRCPRSDSLACWFEVPRA
jgi:predicted ArsR family transcriptional regulator